VFDRADNRVGGILAIVVVAAVAACVHGRGSATPAEILVPKPKFFLDARARVPVVPSGFAYFDEKMGRGGQLVSGEGEVALPFGAWDALPAERQAVHVAVHVCRDAAGVPVPKAMTVLDPIATPDFNAHYVDELSTWRFAPYVVEGKAVPTCSVIAFDYARGQGEVSAMMIEGRRISGDAAIRLSPETLQWMVEHHVRTLELAVRLCLDAKGAPKSVAVVFPRHVLPHVENEYRRRLMEWRYSPYSVDGKPVEVCTTIIFRYRVR
jgi:hypothetical protein